MEFYNRVVLISGAAGGIGKETAKAFAKEGAKLSLVDVNLEALDQLSKELNIEKDRYLLVAADVRKEEEVERYIKETVINLEK